VNTEGGNMGSGNQSVRQFLWLRLLLILLCNGTNIVLNWEFIPHQFPICQLIKVIVFSHSGSSSFFGVTNSTILSFQSEQEAHRQSLKGSAFKPTLYPMAYFNENPYRSDKPLGPPKKVSPKIQVTPFKPSSPAKKVS